MASLNSCWHKLSLLGWQTCRLTGLQWTVRCSCRAERTVTLDKTKDWQAIGWGLTGSLFPSQSWHLSTQILADTQPGRRGEGHWPPKDKSKWGVGIQGILTLFFHTLHYRQWLLTSDSGIDSDTQLRNGFNLATCTQATFTARGQQHKLATLNWHSTWQHSTWQLSSWQQLVYGYIKTVIHDESTLVSRDFSQI
jgi:hypothetical protein